MTRAADPHRPKRSDVAASYDLGVEAYIDVWSRVIPPPAQTVVAALDIAPDARVVDIGAGTGALYPSIKRAAPSSTVLAIDASVEMLRAARTRTDAIIVLADASSLPLRDDAADTVLLAFVLFHLSDPGQALVEATRVLRPDGNLGTVTRAHESTLRAYVLFDEILTSAGAPALTARRVDAGLDSPEAMRNLLTASGLDPLHI